MTTIYRRQGRGRPPYLVPVLFFACILLCVGMILMRGVLADIFWRAGTPAAAALQAGRSGFFGAIASKAALERENARLRSALASSTAALTDRDALYKENLRLRGRSVAEASFAIVASIVMRPPATPYDTLIIDAGARDGVVQGARVSAGGGSVIGTISEVYGASARVTLLSAPGATYNAAVRTQGGSDVPVILAGQGAGSLSGEVPQGSSVARGDLVLFPGVQSQFVGTVASIDHKTGSSFATVYLHLPVNLFEISSVSVAGVPPQSDAR